MTIDYTKAKIYRLVCNKTGLIYYGSTTVRLSQVIYRHKRYYKNLLDSENKKYSCSSQFIIENGDYYIDLVEEFPCQNKEQLLKRERYYIEKYPCVNKRIPGRTIDEYRKIYYICGCGRKLKLRYKAEHMRTKAHTSSLKKE